MRLLAWIWPPYGRRRNCMHHDWTTGVSWIQSQLINTGAGKLFWCHRCGRRWTV